MFPRATAEQGGGQMTAMASQTREKAFDSAMLGPVYVRNRLIRAGTGESMGDGNGGIGDAYLSLHRDLARGGVGLSFTGHIYVDPRGRYGDLQAGLDRDELIPDLGRVTDAVHRAGGRIFAQLGHAGSQSMSFDTDALAPSAVENVMTGRQVRSATTDEIESTIAAFAHAARRAMEAGFDGVHLHGANGYLLSQFRSPLTNTRSDAWGGDQTGRDRFALEVIRAIRREVPADRGFTMKVGAADLVDRPGGLDLDTGIGGIIRFVDAGLDAVEISSNLMSDYVSASIRGYIAVDRRRALRDLLFHRLHRKPEDEAYFLPFADELRSRSDAQIILVGGVRRRQTIVDLVASGRTDFVSMARPFIREPDLALRLVDQGQELPACVSCNICLMHDEHHALRCWRIPRSNLLRHALYRLRGGFKGHGSGRKPSAPPRDE